LLNCSGISTLFASTGIFKDFRSHVYWGSETGSCLLKRTYETRESEISELDIQAALVEVQCLGKIVQHLVVLEIGQVPVHHYVCWLHVAMNNPSLVVQVL
jgi:hypothetical protein